MSDNERNDKTNSTTTRYTLRSNRTFALPDLTNTNTTLITTAPATATTISYNTDLTTGDEKLWLDFLEDIFAPSSNNIIDEDDVHNDPDFTIPPFECFELEESDHFCVPSILFYRLFKI